MSKTDVHLHYSVALVPSVADQTLPLVHYTNTKPLQGDWSSESSLIILWQFSNSHYKYVSLYH